MAYYSGLAMAHSFMIIIIANWMMLIILQTAHTIRHDEARHTHAKRALQSTLLEGQLLSLSKAAGVAAYDQSTNHSDYSGIGISIETP